MSQRHPLTRRPWVEQLEGRLVPSTSSNWSGYAVLAGRGAVTAVSANWVVPAVTGTGTAYSSAWVGIDGDHSDTVEQIGTESDLSRGTPTYYAWYEMYPAGFVTLGLTIQPGDAISASVTAASGKFTLELTDVTTDKSFSVSKRSSQAHESSAEWIQEAPSGGRGVLKLADFGSITFSGARATISSTTGPIDASFGANTSIDEITMVQSGRTATPSALTDSGNPATSSFTVTFGSSGAAGGGSSGKANRRQPDVMAVQIALPFGSGASVTLGTSVAAAGQQGLPSFAPAPVVANVAPASFGPLGGALGGHAADAGPPDGTPGTQPAEPELLPPPNESGKPVERWAPPTNPDAVPAPSGDESPACLEGSAAVYRGACDACFVDGRCSAPAAPEQAGRAGFGGEAGTTAGAAAGLMFTLALGGSGRAAREDGPARRRRPRPR